MFIYNSKEWKQPPQVYFKIFEEKFKSFLPIYFVKWCSKYFSVYSFTTNLEIFSYFTSRYRRLKY